MTASYAICPLPAADHAVWDEVVETPETVRTSVDGVDCVLKWDTADGTPPSLPAEATTYTHEGVLMILDSAHWTPAD